MSQLKLINLLLSTLTADNLIIFNEIFESNYSHCINNLNLNNQEEIFILYSNKFEIRIKYATLIIFRIE